MEEIDSDDESRPARVDGAVRWLEETVVESPRDPVAPRRQGSVLAAAMIAVGEILEPDKVSVDIEVEAEAPGEDSYDLPFTVGFGDLPDLT